MSRAAQSAISQGAIEAINARSWATLATLMAPQIAANFQASPFLTAFPDAQISIDELLVDGDRVIMRWTNRGTHLGPFQGIAATGRAIEVSGISIDQIVDGKIVDSWIVSDTWDLLQQLGATLDRAGSG